MTALLVALGALVLAVAVVLGYGGRARSKLALGLAAFVIILSTALYAFLGAPLLVPQLSAWQAHQAELEENIAQAEITANMHPGAAHWATLGELYMEADAFSRSAEAYRQAVVASHGAPGLILQYAKAQIFAADGTVTDDAKQGLDMVLLQDKENPEARYFTALWELQHGDTAHAMQDMRALYHSLPADSPLKAIIDRQIGRK